jgi:hypothetical protein
VVEAKAVVVVVVELTVAAGLVTVTVTTTGGEQAVADTGTRALVIPNSKEEVPTIRGLRACIGSRGAGTPEGGSIRLAALDNRGLGGRVKEEVRVIGGILSLDEAVQLGITGRLLAKYGVPERRRVGRKVGRSVLLALTELDSQLQRVIGGAKTKIVDEWLTLTILAAVVASSFLLASIISSARSCWAHSGAAASKVLTGKVRTRMNPHDH